jgi:hypothetical protein
VVKNMGDLPSQRYIERLSVGNEKACLTPRSRRICLWEGESWSVKKLETSLRFYFCFHNIQGLFNPAHAFTSCFFASDTLVTIM